MPPTKNKRKKPEREGESDGESDGESNPVKKAHVARFYAPLLLHLSPSRLPFAPSFPPHSKYSNLTYHIHPPSSLPPLLTSQVQH
jgi:hypothetical protein